MNKILCLILIAVTLQSCGDLVKFEEPQPTGKNNLNDISKKLRGTYLSVSDSSFLTINKQTIVKWIEADIRTLIDSLDIEIDSSKISSKSDNLIEITDSEFKLTFEFEGDSVFGHYSHYDTIFRISENHILRKFKGHYFLNYKRSEDNWNVRKITLNKGVLTFSEISVPEDIEKIQQITDVKEIKSDSGQVVGYKINPSRKELKKLLNQNFTESETYKKIK